MTDVLAWKVQVHVIAYINVSDLEILKMVLGLSLLFTYLCGCAGPLLPRGLFPRCAVQGLLSSCHARVPHCRGLSCCRAQVLGLCCSMVRGTFPDQGSATREAQDSLFYLNGPLGKREEVMRSEIMKEARALRHHPPSPVLQANQIHVRWAAGPAKDLGNY